MKNITVGEFIVESQNNFPGFTGELSKILSAVKLASKIVSHQINKAGLAKEILVSSGRAISESQRIMDIIPSELRQRVPFFVGSKSMIDQLEEIIESELKSF